MKGYLPEGFLEETTDKQSCQRDTGHYSGFVFGQNITHFLLRLRPWEAKTEQR
jgi:hypothetical protein